MPEAQTIPELFLTSIERFGTKRAALRYRDGDVWRNITHQDLERRVKLASLGLREIGLQPGDRVAILSHNRPEWAIADLACQMLGCPDVAVYPTLPAEQAAYIIDNSGARAIFVEDAEQYTKIESVRSKLPELEHVIVISGEAAETDLTFESLKRKGAAIEAVCESYRTDALKAEPEGLATLIYTSGTTGKPKGVMLSHRNFCSNVEAVSHVLSCGPDDSCLSFLPLSHSFERLAGFYHMLSRGVTINYAETMETVARDLIEVAPTLLIGVPRVYEKIYARVLENATEGTAIKRRIFFWSKRNAELWADATLDKKPISAALAVKRAIADKLVFTKLRARTGGRVRFMVSGAAPLSPDIAKFFYAAGLPIIEGYGLTETSPVISVNPLDGIKLGFVGPPIPGVEVRIADDGEICARGPNIMLGYHANPQATAEVIDAEGWFHTGDIGEIDADGYIRITDRKKDIIVTAGGKNIAPQPIENMVKLNGYILNVVMLGDKRRFPIMLVVPDDAALGKWAAERGLTGLTKSELLAHPDALAKIEREVMRELRGLASYETPKKVVLLEEDFSVENGELTPTLKIKRRVVEERYSDLIERTYQD